MSSRPAASAARVTGNRVRSSASMARFIAEVGDRASNGAISVAAIRIDETVLSGTSCPAGATPSQDSVRRIKVASDSSSTDAAHACSRPAAPTRPTRASSLQVTVSTSVTKAASSGPGSVSSTSRGGGHSVESDASAPASCRSGSSSASNSSADSVGSVGVDAANAAHSSSDIGSGGTVQETPLSRTGRGSESTAPARPICVSFDLLLERMFEV